MLHVQPTPVQQLARFVHGGYELCAESSTFIYRSFEARANRVLSRLVRGTSERRYLHEEGPRCELHGGPRRQRDLLATVRGRVYSLRIALGVYGSGPHLVQTPIGFRDAQPHFQLRPSGSVYRLVETAHQRIGSFLIWSPRVHDGESSGESATL